MAIRAERRSVEGDQCRTGGLGAGYAFQHGVGEGHGAHLAGNEALSLNGVRVGAIIVSLPRRPDGGILCDRFHLVGEDQVGAACQLVPVRLDQRIFGGFVGIPAVKKGQDRPGGGRVHPVQQRVVKLGGGGKALLCPLRFSFGVYAQQIGGVVT